MFVIFFFVIFWGEIDYVWVCKGEYEKHFENHCFEH